MTDVSKAYLNETPEDLFHDQNLDLQEWMRNPIAFHAEMMGNIMYYQQALQQPDAHQFAKAIVKEVDGHVENNHWQLIKCKDVPEDAQVVPSVWSMQRKTQSHHQRDHQAQGQVESSRRKASLRHELL